ncbi:hypothetical protein ABE178_15675 [Priestia megaterium]
MRDYKPLKPIKLSMVPELDIEKYMINEQAELAIKIPDKVLNVFSKIPPYDEEEYRIVGNLIAHVINYRRLSNVYDSLMIWENERLEKIPLNDVHVQINKIITGVFKCSPLKGLFTDSDFDELRAFIFRCPANYDLSRHIRCAMEFKPLLT